MRKELIFRLLGVAILVFPMQMVWLVRVPYVGGERLQYGSLGLYASDILLLLACFLFIWERSFSDRSVIRRCLHSSTTRVLFCGVLTWLWIAASAWWAAGLASALLFLLKGLLVGSVFYSVRLCSQKERRLLVVLLLIGAVAQSFLAIAQFSMQTVTASRFLGMSAQEAWQAGTSVLKLDSGRWLRSYGTWPHPNILGGYLAGVLVLGWASLIAPSANRYRPWGWSGVIILLGLLLSFSRAAWLGATLGMGAWALFVVGTPTAQKMRTAHVRRGLSVLVVALIVFVAVLHPLIFSRFDTAVVGRELSVSERVRSLSDAWELVVKHPLTGNGAGHFSQALLHLHPERPVWSVQPAHNVPLLLLAEIGVIGLLLITTWISLWIRSGYQAGAIRGVTLCLFLTLLPSLLLDHWLWTSHAGLTLGALLMSMSLRTVSPLPIGPTEVAGGEAYTVLPVSVV